MRIASAATAFPPYRYSQEEILGEMERTWAPPAGVFRRLRDFMSSVEVDTRHLSVPLDRYGSIGTFGQANDLWIEGAVDLGSDAVSRALEQAGVAPGEVDAFFFVSVTGISSPSVDAKIVNTLGLSPQVKRTPIFGLGCVAGASGLARAADYLRAYPDHVAVVLSVELCSLTFQRADLSVQNLVASCLFGDGAAVAVLVGSERDARRGAASSVAAHDARISAQPEPRGGAERESPAGAERDPRAIGPRIISSRASFYPGTEEVMGWSISEDGFRIVLSASVPEVVAQNVPADIAGLLEPHGRQLEEIGSWICHPGGPKILNAMQQALRLDDADLAVTRRCLREYGNLSSASLLVVLEQAMHDARPAPGTPAVLMAMGPGFCSEMLLAEW